MTVSSNADNGSAMCFTRLPKAAMMLARGRGIVRSSVALTCVLPLMQRK